MTDRPIAPVQDDDAELRLRDFCRDAWGDKERLNPSSNKSATMGDLRKLLASRLSPTPETGLVEALTAVNDAMLNGGDGVEGDFGWSITKLNKARPLIRTALSNVSLSDG